MFEYVEEADDAANKVSRRPESASRKGAHSINKAFYLTGKLPPARW